MTRFELLNGEKLLSEKRRTYWKNLKHAGNFGSLYLTDKRLVFNTTARTNSFPSDHTPHNSTKPRNTPQNTAHQRAGHTKGTGLHSKLNFLTIDGDNTNVAADEDFINLLDALKG